MDQELHITGSLKNRDGDNYGLFHTTYINVE